MTLRKLAVPPALMGIIDVTGFLGFRAWGRRGRRGRRPTIDRLMSMSDGDFAAQIEAWGLKTVTMAGLAHPGTSVD
jgi:hypothetical protein